MNVIDIHTHTFPEKIATVALEKLKAKCHTKNFTDGTFNALAMSMKGAGINHSVIQPVATSSKQVIHVNDASIRINNNAHETGIFSFGAMHPDFEGVHEELTRLSRAGIMGIKLHPVYQGVDINDERYTNILECAGNSGLVVMIHAGLDIGFPGAENSTPEKISRAIARTSGHVKIILAHMGSWKCWDKVCELFAGMENIYIDTAFSLGKFTPLDDGYYSGPEDCEMLSEKDFVQIVNSFGANRVLFGTDSPWASQYDSVKNFVALPLSEHDKNLILYENSASLLGLK